MMSTLLRNKKKNKRKAGLENEKTLINEIKNATGGGITKSFFSDSVSVQKQLPKFRRIDSPIEKKERKKEKSSPYEFIDVSKLSITK